MKIFSNVYFFAGVYCLLGIALPLFLVIVMRLQAFLTLLIASLFVAILGGVPPAEIANTIQEGLGTRQTTLRSPQMLLYCLM